MRSHPLDHVTTSTQLPTSIDRAGCRCGGCREGSSVSLENANDELVLRMLRGEIPNKTGHGPDRFIVATDGNGQLIKIVRPNSVDSIRKALRTVRAS